LRALGVSLFFRRFRLQEEPVETHTEQYRDYFLMKKTPKRITILGGRGDQDSLDNRALAWHSS